MIKNGDSLNVRAQRKGKKEFLADRRSGGKTILKSGEDWI